MIRATWQITFSMNGTHKMDSMRMWINSFVAARAGRLAYCLVAGAICGAVTCGVATSLALADEPVAAGPSPAIEPHPIDPALLEARAGLKQIRDNVDDYTATIVKRERVNGKLGEIQYMFAKIRNRKENADGSIKTPFSVYLKFLEPQSVKGREVIWVEGRNGNKLIAHEGGLLNLGSVYLNPDGFLAMIGNRYPISKIGMENLVAELIAKGEAQRAFGECEVKFYKGAKVDGRVCRMIEVVHPTPRPHFDFYRARIFIDDELNVPIRYAAWSWPEKPDGEPVLLEEYTYRNVELNVGLTDEDFDPEHEDYRF